MVIQKVKNPVKKAFSVYLGKQEDEKLNILVKNTGFNQSEIIRRLIRNAEIENIETMDDKIKRLSKGKTRVVQLIPEDEKDKDFTLDDMIGTVTIPEEAKPFNPVEAVRELRTERRK